MTYKNHILKRVSNRHYFISHNYALFIYINCILPRGESKIRDNKRFKDYITVVVMLSQIIKVN